MIGVLSFSCFLFFIPILGQDIETNLTKPRSKEFSNWCSIRFNDDHHGWSANQPLNELTSVLVLIPPKWNITEIQITACDKKGKVGNSGHMARIFDPSFTTIFYFALEYWGGALTVYINFPECNYQLWPGIPPDK